MGASGWSYFTPWQPDPAKALQDLREEVFATGDYGEARVWEKALQSDALSGMPPAALEQMREALAQRKKIDDQFGRSPGKAKSIQEALELAETEGTHSILDISQGLSQKPGFATASPAPHEWLMTAYANLRPTRQQVESTPFEPAENLERWQCVFFPVWENPTHETPKWWYFEGCSGD